VDPALAPGYLEVVALPMDLGTVMTRLEDGHYHYHHTRATHTTSGTAAAPAAAAEAEAAAVADADADAAVDAAVPMPIAEQPLRAAAALMACINDVRQVCTSFLPTKPVPHVSPITPFTRVVCAF
jgi:hypothetical protein